MPALTKLRSNLIKRAMEVLEDGMKDYPEEEVLVVFDHNIKEIRLFGLKEQELIHKEGYEK